MATPPKGDYSSVPLNPAGRKAVPTEPTDGEIHILRVRGNVYMLVGDGGNIVVRSAAKACSSSIPAPVRAPWRCPATHSVGHFRQATGASGVDAWLQNHPLIAPFQDWLTRLSSRGRNDTNPFVVGRAEYQKFLGAMEGCSRIALARRGLWSCHGGVLRCAAFRGGPITPERAELAARPRRFEGGGIYVPSLLYRPYRPERQR